MAYDAFISYRHGADDTVAEAIERGLERLARPWNRLRAMSVFRDQSDLPAESDLSGAITRRLDDIQYLVLVASRESAESRWVEKEMAYWCAKPNGIKQVIVVVTNGEFKWDEKSSSLTPSSDSVSPAVRSRFTTEPVFVDLHWARAASELSLRDSRFRSAIVLIAATIRGVAPADLESEDVRLHRRARRLARGAVATILVLALVASLAAVVAVANARRAERRARDALGRQLGLTALDLPASEVDQAFLLSLVAADLDSGDDADRFQPSRALIARYSRLDQLLYAPAGTTNIRDVAISPTDDRTVVATSSVGGTTSVLTWTDDDRSDPVHTNMAGGLLPTVSFTGDGNALIGAPQNEERGQDPHDVVLLGDPGPSSRTIAGSVAIDSVGGLAATSAANGSLQLTRIDDGTILAQSLVMPGAVDLRFGRAATMSGGRVVVLDASNGAAGSATGTVAAAGVVGAGPDDRTAAVTVSEGQMVGWRRVGDRLESSDRGLLPDGVGDPQEVIVSYDGARVLVVGDNGAALVRLADGVVEALDSGASGIVSVDPAGHFAAIGGTRLTIWDLAGGRSTFSVPRPVNAMAWSGPCEQESACTLATVGESLDTWRPGSDDHVELVDQTNATAVDISADGATVVTAGWGPTVAVWQRRPIAEDSGRREIDAGDIDTGRDARCAVVHEGELRAVSPDGTLVVTRRRDDKTTTVCDAADGSIVATAPIGLPAAPPDTVAVDDQGNVVIGGGGGFVAWYQGDGESFAPGRAIDARLGSEPVVVTALAHRAGMIAAGIRPAVGGAVASVFVWPLAGGGTPARFETDLLEVSAIALLGDSAQYLAVAGHDTPDGPVTLQIWETLSRRRLGRALQGLSGNVVALSGDESAVVAVDSGGRAYRWELDHDPTREICRIVGRSLTDGEWETLAGGVLDPYAAKEFCAG